MHSFKVRTERCGIADMGLFTIVLIFFVGHTLSFEILEEEERRQQLFPFPRVGRRSYWDFLDEKRGGLVPFPRTGRSDADDDVKDLLDEWLENAEFDASLLPLLKRANFLPRIGRRKKRSISEDFDVDDLEKNQLPRMGDISSKGHHVTGEAIKSDVVAKMNDLLSRGNQWQARPMDPPMIEGNFSWRSADDGDRMERQLVPYPRIGRAKFNPRVGKKLTMKIRDEFRKRAALIPRVGRADPKIQTRAAFQPRVGRALIPRVGRSGKNTDNY